MNEFFDIHGIRTEFRDDTNAGIFPAACGTTAHHRLLESGLAMVLEDNRIYRPAWDGAPKYIRYRTDHAERLELQNLIWKDNSGARGDIFRIGLRYEIDDSGAVFVNAFFHGENLHAPAIRAFRLEMRLHLQEFREVRWEDFTRSPNASPTEILLTPQKRYMTRGEGKRYDGMLPHRFSFHCWDDYGGSTYLELFIESANPLAGDNGIVAAEVRWQNGDAILEWNFQAAEYRQEGLIWQWRNQWGWIVKGAPTLRRLPPLRMYHYFDNFNRYPSDRQIDKIARNGADVLIIHENWRLDVQNDAYPFDADELRRVIDRTHRNNLRVVLYTRGNERSVAGEFAPWFDYWLKKDWDGLYMDYGSPYNELETATEGYPNGSFLYRKFLERLYRLRERVGEYGLLISHTGASFSALGMAPNLLNMFVSGECEAGRMIHSVQEHDYFAASLCSPGSMWTAAFPEYGTEQMTPFMALAGQSPHCPLGIQFKSSSLAHCGEPGIENRLLRPLWKLWGLFANKRNIRFYNHLNSTLQNASMAVTGEGAALLLLINFTDHPQELFAAPDWNRYGITTPRSILKFAPDAETPHPPAECSKICATVPAYGAVGFLVNGEDLIGEIAEYQRPYPKEDDADREYASQVEFQHSLRKYGNVFSSTYLRVRIPPMPLPYEKSMIDDLYNNAIAIGCFDDRDAFQILGWLGRRGLTAESPSEADYLHCGDETPWIEITSLRHPKMALQSFHAGVPYYSFVEAEFSPQPSTTPDSFTIHFLNELEPDRSFLRWEMPEEK